MKRKEKDRNELYWCKNYQRNNFSDTSPHMAQIKADEPPVPVLHYCALCLQ